MWRQVISSVILVAVGSFAVLGPWTAEAQNAVPTREVAPPGREPYHGSVVLDVPGVAGNTVEGSVDEPIPVNRRLVIEYVSARVSNLPESAAPLLVIQDLLIKNNQQSERLYVIPLTFVGLGEWRAAHTLRLYHEGGGVNPRFQAGFGSGLAVGQVQFDVSISGYLIPR